MLQTITQGEEFISLLAYKKISHMYFNLISTKIIKHLSIFLKKTIVLSQVPQSPTKCFCYKKSEACLYILMTLLLLMATFVKHKVLVLH